MWVCTERFLQDREWRTNSIKKIRKPDSNTERSSELSCCISHLIFVIIGFILVMGTIFTTSALWSAVRYVALLAVFRSSGWKMLVLLAANYELCSVNAASSATVRYPSESCQVSEYCIYLLVFCFGTVWVSEWLVVLLWVWGTEAGAASGDFNVIFLFLDRKILIVSFLLAGGIEPVTFPSFPSFLTELIIWTNVNCLVCKLISDIFNPGSIIPIF